MKAFHKGGFAPRWGTLNLKSGEITVENDAITSGDFVIDMTTLKVDPASVTEADKKPADLEAHLKMLISLMLKSNQLLILKSLL